MTARRVCALVALICTACAACSATAAATTAALGCPVDTEPRPDGVLLQVVWPSGAPDRYTKSELARLPAAQLKQRRIIEGSGGRSDEQVIRYDGVLLRELLLQRAGASGEGRMARDSLVEAVATDGYRAWFSWMELFNSAAGDNVLVVTAQDGNALDERSGPLALRSLADYRPGPRHVRNLCAVRGVMRSGPHCAAVGSRRDH
jgi:hypothetical protein